MSKPIKFIRSVADQALSASNMVVSQWLPDGKRQGREWMARNPKRADHHRGSFAINLDSGRWSDFATGDAGGDLVSLVAYLEDCSQLEAARQLDEFLGMDCDLSYSKPKKENNSDSLDSVLHMPIPDDSPGLPVSHPNFGCPSAIWTYSDERGNTLFHTCRFDPPGQRKRVLPLTLWQEKNGRLSWLWRACPNSRALYNLDRLAAFPDATVIVTEGEKAADAAARLLPEPSFVTTTSSGGAQAPGKTDWAPLKNRIVWIWPDNDEPGQQFATRVAKLAYKAGAAEVHIIDLNAFSNGQDNTKRILRTGWDAHDALEEGFITDVHELIKNHLKKTKKNESSDTTHKCSPKIKKKDQTTVLVELSEELEYIVTPDDEIFAIIQNETHHECWPTKSKEFEAWLSQTFYQNTRKGCSDISIRNALNTINARAKFECNERYSVHLRVANLGDRFYIDLCDKLWQVIEVSEKGWKVLNKSPVFFTRKKGMAALPAPTAVTAHTITSFETSNGIKFLNNFLNVTEDQFSLVTSWLMAALSGTTPYPILVLQGEQGSGKSSASKVIRSLVDPSIAPLRSPSKKVRDLLVSATNNHVVVLDNLSGLSQEMSDALCRLSTGGAMDFRKLYSNMEQILINIQRPVIVNGIDDIATRPDLAERSLILNLPIITEKNRQDERRFWGDFEIARPYILAALLDGLVMALKRRDSITLEWKPRMADFAYLAVAAEAAYGHDGRFLEAYTRNSNDAVEAGIEASPIGASIIELMEDRIDWVGRGKDLLEMLNDIAGPVQTRSREWPQSLKGLANALKRLAPPLRFHGIEISRFKDGKGHRLYKIMRSPSHVPYLPSSNMSFGTSVESDEIKSESNSDASLESGSNDQKMVEGVL